MRLQSRAVALEVGDRQPLLNLHAQDLGREGFGDEINGAHLHRLDRRLDRAIGRDDHDRGARVERLDTANHLQAVDGAHLEVGDDEVERLFGERRATIRAVRADGDLVAHFGNGQGDALTHRVVVVDDEDSRHAAFSFAVA